MKRILQILSLLVCIELFSAGGCAKDPVVNPGGSGGNNTSSSLSLAYSEGDVLGVGATVNVNVTCNTSWKVKTNVTYLNIVPSSGEGNSTVKVTFPQNTSTSERQATLTFTAGSISKDVTIKQLGFSEFVSIASVRSLFTGSSTKITSDVKIKGSVISDYRKNEGGVTSLNNATSARSIIISDGEAGIMLYCASENSAFAPGDELSVSLKNQSLSRYENGPIQVNGIPLANITKIGTKPLSPVKITAAQLVTGAFESVYVSVDDVQFTSKCAGVPFVTEDAGSAVHTTLNMESKTGESFDVFSSKYSSFGKTASPKGSGTISGIAGCYGDRIQLSFAKLSDFSGLNGARFGASASFNLQSLSYSTRGDAGTARIGILANVPWTASVDNPDCTLSKTSGKTDETIILKFPDNPSTTASKVTTVTVTTTDAQIKDKELKFVLTQDPYEPLIESPVLPLLELPKIDDRDSVVYISHDVGNFHNYSIYYDLKNKLSLWTAYRIDKKTITSTVSRQDTWNYDPLVPRRDQPNLTTSYANSSVTNKIRGHLVPSGDRLGSGEINDQTFYFTNIAPQDYNMNAGIWEDLESKLRTLVKNSTCDTLYIVTGVILSPENENKFVTDKAGVRVALPKQFFKAVLQYRVSETANGGYIGAAFVFNNEAVNHKTLTASDFMTIDALEKLSGFDFFANLPATVQTAAESVVDPSKWGVK